MMVKRRRIANRDALLVFLATFVLALSFLRDKTPVQVVHVHGSSPQSYVATLSDSTRLQRKLQNWSVPPVDGRTEAYHWISEASRFYAAQPNGPQVWQRVAEESDQLANVRTHQITQHYASLGPAPVQLGELATAPISADILTLAIALSLGCIAVFAIWQMMVPSREWAHVKREIPILDVQGLNDQGLDDQGLDGQESGVDEIIAIELPQQWVSVKQTMGVHVRRAVMALLVTAAIALSFV
ncbi:hypothetical protein Pla22_32920 [Rubripirellula amarantea]|uniref:Uncharacterized protein n=2 Tax=Rubripirellula amarantea TaxID=2527999 RepID=A0A5C5WK90_9BACT|nr:hypothetical protein Pla22_32920 [Rubripirellula amarantea]